MADSIRERCLARLQSDLQAITVANGYANTIQSVQRYRQGGQVLLDVPLILIREGTDSVEEEPLSLVTRRLQIGLLVGTNYDDGADARSGDTVCNGLRADIQKCLAADWNLSGLAIDVKEIASEEIETDDDPKLPPLLFGMEYEIHYRHRRDDPTLAE